MEISFPTLAIELKADTISLKIARRRANSDLSSFERRNAEGQQTANLRMTVEDHRLDAVAHQHIGAGPARPARRR
ncbi:Uncharacterised protein [Klebsiella pneumoniae]|nr:Uncharacterised protein [Klebsiella pneumoniae]